MTAAPGRIAAIVLAAGASSRTAPAHKLLAPDATGLPMIARTLRAVMASRADPVVVVLGHRAAEIRQAAMLGLEPGRLPHFIIAPDHAHGLSRTLAAGVGAVMDDPTITGALICLGDMPLVGTELLDRMMATFHAHPGCPGVLATHEGRRGNPVLWSRSLFAALTAGHGDSGARHLLARHATAMPRVAAGAEITADFDTPERLAEFSRLFGAEQLTSARASAKREGSACGAPHANQPTRTHNMSKIIRTEPNAILSKVVEYHGFLFTQGFVARDLSADITAQTKDVLAQIDAALELHGTDNTRLLQTQIWLKDINDRDALNAVWGPWLPKGGAPARACVEAKMAHPDVLVEIMVIATK